MKPGILFVNFLSMFVAMPALAFDANSCVAKSSQVKLSERNAYMKSCLAQASSPDSVREAELRDKRALCEQNAKNYSLQGNDRVNYITSCMNKNEAAVAAKEEAAKTNKSARAVAKAEPVQEKPVKSAVKPVSAKAGAGVKPKAKAKPKDKK